MNGDQISISIGTTGLALLIIFYWGDPDLYDALMLFLTR